MDTAPHQAGARGWSPPLTTPPSRLVTAHHPPRFGLVTGSGRRVLTGHHHPRRSGSSPGWNCGSSKPVKNNQWFAVRDWPAGPQLVRCGAASTETVQVSAATATATSTGSHGSWWPGPAEVARIAALAGEPDAATAAMATAAVAITA